MIYQYTGQPGHGKTLHALDQAIDFRDAGRLVYVCNVRGFDHGKARMLPLAPEQFHDWMNTTPEGCVILVDECYEHEMLPKRPAGSRVPEHVKQLAKHRHSGRDFIFVCQSPSKQMDDFIHDNIERHTHVRRRFGMPFAHLRIWDRYERNPEKGSPLILKRVKLPKRPMGLYESTVMDTTERKVPWYYPAAAALLLCLVASVVWMGGHLDERFTGGTAKAATVPGATLTDDRAGARASGGVASVDEQPKWRNAGEYAKDHLPRFGTMPWTAPVFDDRRAVADPQLYCMSSEDSCTCLTEQGSRYELSEPQCRTVARFGMDYNPYKAQQAPEPAPVASHAGIGTPAGAAPLTSTLTAPVQVTEHGGMAARPVEVGPELPGLSG